VKACINHILKILELCRIVFLSHKLWFFMEHFFCNFFYCWACTYFLSFDCDLHLIKVLHNKWYSLHHVCIMGKTLIEKISGPKREVVLFSLMFFQCIFFLKIILICASRKYDLSYMHLIITIKYKPYDTNQFILLQECFKWHVSFKRGKSLNT
jgi:hypothetical protein